MGVQNLRFAQNGYIQNVSNEISKGLENDN
jgi:hypothetical protein